MAGTDQILDFVGTWKLESITIGETAMNLGGISTASFPDRAAWLEFRDDGIIHGEVSCNDFSGEYSRVDGSISTSEVLISAVGCAKGRGLEARLTALLWGDGIEIEVPDPEVLHLRDGAVLLEMTRAR